MQTIQGQIRRMSTQWISRLGRSLAALYEPNLAPDDERDADARRLRSELEAIRIRFPDHA